MVTITNGVQTFKVTEGAFKNIFKAQGYFKADEQEKTGASVEATEITTVTPEVHPEEFTTEEATQQSEDKILVSEDEPETEPETELEDLSEIPLSEMTNKQLTAYAAQLGVDIKGVKSKRVVIDRIRAAL